MSCYEMAVDRQADRRAHRVEERNAKAEIRHEVAVHDVQMDPVRACGLQPMQFIPQLEEIAVQYRRRNDQRNLT